MSKLFLCPRPVSAPKLRLFCFPYAGGGGNTYLPWARKLNDEVELVFVQTPGRGSRISEQPHDTMASLINELIHNASYFTRTPYAFFGHSLGSRVAYELCIQFKNFGLPLPKHFFASGSRAPHLISENKSIYNLPENEFIKEIEQLNGTPREVLNNKELIELFLPLLRADFKLADTYRANEIKMPFPITVLHGKDDVGIKREQLAAWGRLSAEEYSLVEFEGDHFFINQSGHKVLEHVSSVLNSL